MVPPWEIGTAWPDGRTLFKKHQLIHWYPMVVLSQGACATPWAESFSPHPLLTYPLTSLLSLSYLYLLVVHSVIFAHSYEGVAWYQVRTGCDVHSILVQSHNPIYVLLFTEVIILSYPVIFLFLVPVPVSILFVVSSTLPCFHDDIE